MPISYILYILKYLIFPFCEKWNAKIKDCRENDIFIILAYKTSSSLPSRSVSS